MGQRTQPPYSPDRRLNRMASVSLRKLTKRYGDFTAVDGIDLDIADGEMLVLLGPSGCGKTTTLRCIAGLEDVSGGQILMGDRVVSQPGRSIAPEQRNIGMVFQSYAVWPHLTVFENVAFGLRRKRVSTADIGRRVNATLGVVGLSGSGERSVSKLSGGQQQRVALARAIVLEPQVLLFDEPLSNLDAKLRERMRFELRQLQQRLGITSIYVTHDQQEAMVIADRIALMHEGHIDQIGTPVDIYEQPASLFGAEFLGLANIWPGQVIDDGNPLSVRTAGALELSTAGHGFRAGDFVHVMCRPEHVTILRDSIDRPNAFRAKVAQVVFLGNLADIYVEIGDLRLRGQFSPPQIWPTGMDVWVHLPPERLVLFRRPETEPLQT